MKCINCNNAGKCLDHKEQPSLIGCTSGIPQRNKQTNADRIHSMNIKELAEFLITVETYGYHDQSVSGNLEMFEWLQSEVEE